MDQNSQSQNYNVEQYSKYYRIKEVLLKEIHKGKYAPRSKIPSVRNIMKEWNITRVTASHVIDELVKDGAVYTIPGKGCFVADFPDKQQPRELSRLSRKIAFITTNVTVQFYAQVFKGILDVAQSKDYTVEIYNSNIMYSNETKFLAKCLESSVSGLIFIPSYTNGDYRHLFQLKKKGVPVVLVDHNIDNYDFDHVSSKNTEGAKKAVNYLIKIGHRKIVFLGTIKNLGTLKYRLEGYMQALKSNRIKIDPKLILVGDEKMSFDFHTGKDEGYERMKRFLSKKMKFTAIFASGAHLLIGGYRALREKNIKVPDDVSLVGFDDTPEMQNIEGLSITGVRQDPYRMGYYAAKLLLKRIDDRLYKKPGLTGEKKSKKILLNTKLMVRESVRKLKGRKN